MYESPPTSFEELLAPLPEQRRDLATQLREIITRVLPDAEERIYGGTKMGMTLYSVGSTNDVICGIQPTEASCKLFFHGWQELQRQGFWLEGSGKKARHVKIGAASDIDVGTLEEMLVSARTACGK